MTTKQKILHYAEKNSPFKSSILVRKLGISRQNIAGHLSRLVELGQLIKQGSTRGAIYAIPIGANKYKGRPVKPLLLTKNLKRIDS